jgi:hypothetical protein
MGSAEISIHTRQQFEHLTAMLLKIGVLCGVTRCLDCTGTITCENTALFMGQCGDLKDIFRFSKLLKFYVILMTEYRGFKHSVFGLIPLSHV